MRFHKNKAVVAAQVTFCLTILGSVSTFAQAEDQNQAGEACSYVEQLAALQESKPEAKPFRLLRSLAIGTKGDEIEVLSEQNLADLPHILFGMAQTSLNVDQLERKPIDMPTIDGFLALAKIEYEAGRLSAVKWRYLQSMNAIGSGSALRSARASAVHGKIEASFPGVITGKAGSFIASKSFNDFLESTRLRRGLVGPEDWSKFEVWVKALPLMTGSFSEPRARDIRQTLAILERAQKSRQNLAEYICLWQLRERFLAQTISFVGLHGAPVLKESGHLNTEL